MVTWGSNTTASFAPSTPASTTPAAATAFGTPAPAGGGSSLFAGSTPGPNAAAAPTPGGFGFGTPSTAATGAATAGSAGSSLFGAAPTPGLFGSTPAAAAPATGGLFGTPSPAPAQGGLFGTPAPAPASGGLFGAAAPATTSPFAQQQQQQYGQQQYGQQQQQQQAAAAAYSQQQQQHAYHAHQHHLHEHNLRQEAARIESSILELESGYSSAAAGAAPPTFQHIFYDPIDPATRQQQQHGVQPARPVHVDPATWAEAIAHNPDPDNYVPVSVVGAEALQSRIAGQQSRARDYAVVIQKLRGALDEVKRSVGASGAALDNARREREFLRRRLMRVMGKVEIARCMGVPLQPAEREFDADITRMEGDLGRVRVQLREVTDMAEVIKQRRAATARPSTMELSAEDKASLYHVLDEQRKGLEALTKIAMRDLRDVEIVKRELLPQPSSEGVAAGGGIGGVAAPGGLPLGVASGAGARGSVRPFMR